MPLRSRAARRVGWVVFAGLLEVVGGARAGTAGQPGQEPAAQPPTFAATVDVILVDVVVTDAQGHMVKDLTAEDFVLREDDAPQELTSFEAVDRAEAAVTEPRSPLPAAKVRSSANDGPAEPSRRTFIIVMDDAGIGLESAAAARKAARQFLSESTRAGDLVSLVVPVAGLTWSAQLPGGEEHLASIVDSVKAGRAVSPELAGDWEALQVAEARDPLAQERVRVRLDSAGLLPREARSLGESDDSYDARNRETQGRFLRMDSRRQVEADRARRRRLFDAMSLALDGVAAVKGRKSVLLFSEGFIQDANDPSFRDLVATLRRNNASIYYLDMRRLTSGTAADSQLSGDRSAGTRVVDPQESAGAEMVAEQTGGFALRSAADLGGGLRRVAQESSTYYLLGYTSTNLKRDGKYRRLEVGLRRPGLKVRARKGYYGPSTDKSASPSRGRRAGDPELERVLSTALPESGIPLRLTAYTLQPVEKEKVRVRLVGEVGLKALRFEKDGDGSRVATLDVALALNHTAASGRLRTPWQELKVKVPAEAEGSEAWMPFEGTFDAPRGSSQARLAVRDRASLATGTVLHDFDVPDPATWRVSTPILSDMPDAELGRPPRMLVSRSFVAGAPLYCYLEVYEGATLKPTPSSPVSFGYAVVDAQGKTRKSLAASPFTLGPTGIATRLTKIPLSGLSPGDYELRLSVRDEARGRTQELREPFTVRRPSHPDLATYLELIQAFLAGDVGRAAAGVMEWRPRDLEKLAAALPPEDLARRRAALQLHTALAFRLWSNARALEADAQVAIGRAVLGRDSAPDLHRDWILALGYYHLAAASPHKALLFFEEGTRRFPTVAEAWLGAGMCYEIAAFPNGFSFAPLPAQDLPGKAERCFREAVRLDPHLAEARLRRGRVLGLAGAVEDAEKELAAAVEASAEGSLTALAHVFWGSLRDGRGDLPGAVSHYEAALAADPGSQTAAFALSEALHRSGRSRRAVELLAKTLQGSARPLEISPWHAYHLGSGRGSDLVSTPEWAAPVAAGPDPAETP